MSERRSHCSLQAGSVFITLGPKWFREQVFQTMIGPGVAVDPGILLEEIQRTRTKDRIGIDYQTAIIEEPA